ncbi:hypothetical protein BGZ74_006414, partial [Mortierella antarctica]
MGKKEQERTDRAGQRPVADIDPKTTFRIQHTALSDSNLGPDELLSKVLYILLDPVLGVGLRSRGRIAVCGTISTYDDADAQGI